MNWMLAVPVLVGAMTVLQGGLNKHLGSSMGLAAAVLLTCLVTTVIGLALYAWVRVSPSIAPDFLQGEFNWQAFRWWMICPGLFGFGIVIGIPWAIPELGAAKVFVGIVAAQLVGSLVWDAFVEHNSPSTMRLLGAAITLLGAVIASWE